MDITLLRRDEGDGRRRQGTTGPCWRFHDEGRAPQFRAVVDAERRALLAAAGGEAVDGNVFFNLSLPVRGAKVVRCRLDDLRGFLDGRVDEVSVSVAKRLECAAAGLRQWESFPAQV